jgi:hypothetical protein
VIQSFSWAFDVLGFETLTLSAFLVVSFFLLQFGGHLMCYDLKVLFLDVNIFLFSDLIMFWIGLLPYKGFPP